MIIIDILFTINTMNAFLRVDEVNKNYRAN